MARRGCATWKSGQVLNILKLAGETCERLLTEKIHTEKIHNVKVQDSLELDEV